MTCFTDGPLRGNFVLLPTENVHYGRGCASALAQTLAAHGMRRALLITAHQSVLIIGPSGAGKSYLAQALGLNACRNGFTVQYVRLPTLLAQFVQARAQGTYDRLLKRLPKLSLLVIDDFGLATLNELERQDLLEAIEERYGTGATLVTSQLPVGDWHEYPGGGRIADAILDCLVHNAHRIELSSKESMRKEHAALKQGGQSGK